MSTLKIALLQIAPTGSLEGNLTKGIAACREAKALGADIALFPEMWSCGYDICDEAGEVIGHVTSGIMLPTTKVGIGMGYVKTAFAKKETIIYIKIREKLVPAKIV